MAASSAVQQPTSEAEADEQLVYRILSGEIDLFAIIMRRYSARLYRVCFSILRDDAEAEDVMEDAYVRAYQHLDQFAGRAKFSTWLTRIAVNEALMRKRRAARFESLDGDSEEERRVDMLISRGPSPEQALCQKELACSLEDAILALPEHYRLVLILRDVQEMSVAETAECLALSEENVRIRLHRARAALRRELDVGSSNNLRSTFSFPAPRCGRIAAGVLVRLRNLQIMPSLRA